jgi:hypothetical protein
MEKPSIGSALEVGLSYWAALEARDWAAFGALLAPGVVYDLPQTRERVRGRDAYLRFNVEYPGDWHARVVRVVGAGRQVATWVRVSVGDDAQDALTFLTVDDDGLVSTVTDFWPEPYDPPPGREHLVERY